MTANPTANPTGAENAWAGADDIDAAADRRTRFACTDRAAPAGWSRTAEGPWVMWRPGAARLPSQGWKIHVSARFAEADEVVSLVWAYCVEHALAFKFLRSTEVLKYVDGKQSARGSSGKLIAIYPRDEPELEQTLGELSEVLRGRRGPYILSDLRWGAGPLHLRYGGFAARYCLDSLGEVVPAVENAEGVLVPDVRGPVFTVPDWVEPPEFVRAAVKAALSEAPEGFPFRIERVLQFSNGGGVYLATDTRDGRRVVLREARPFAGLDAYGTDAVTRLLAERDALERLAGLDVAPELYEHLTWWEHHYLVEEYVEGLSLHKASGARHPIIWPPTQGEGRDTEELRAYTAWALDVLEQLERALAQIHSRGLVFGDLHPGNIVVRPDGRVALVDFELAFDPDGPGRPGLGAAGFVSPAARRGLAVDEYALDCLRLSLFLPLTPLIALDAGKARQLLDEIRHRFPVPRDYAAQALTRLEARPAAPATAPGPLRPHDLGRPGTDWRTVTGAMAEAIRQSATPERADRLFPGDGAGAATGGTSLAHGAAGVLYALHATGHEVPGEHLDWLHAAARRLASPRPGLWDGLTGVAYTLDLLGRTEPALELLARADELPHLAAAAQLHGGLAGIGLARLHFARSTGDAAFGEQAVAIGERIGELADDRGGAGTGPGPGSVIAPTVPGLMRGWSGPALLFVRLHELTGESRWLDRAARALRRDLAHCRTPDQGGLMVSDRDVDRWLLYLEHGSGGIALVLREYLDHRDDEEFARALDQVRFSLGSEFAMYSGLFQGRAGLLHCLDRIGCPDSTARHARDRHLRQLAWHAVPSGTQLAFPGHQMRRVAMDLGTGTAGVLLAVHAAVNGSGALPLLARA